MRGSRSVEDELTSFVASASADDLVQSALATAYVHWRRVRAADDPTASVSGIVLTTFRSERRRRSSSEVKNRAPVSRRWPWLPASWPPLPHRRRPGGHAATSSGAVPAPRMADTPEEGPASGWIRPEVLGPAGVGTLDDTWGADSPLSPARPPMTLDDLENLVRNDAWVSYQQ